VLADVLERGLSAEWSRRCLAMVDGRGTERVRAAMTTVDRAQLRARPASFDDEGLLLEWANDPVTRRNAFAEGVIRPAEHHAWLEARLADPDGCRLFIVETSERVPIGQVRFDRLPEGWKLSYALAPAFRGRRLGRPLLEVAMGELACEPAETIVAEVKPANASSQRVLRSLGFEERRVGDVFEYRRALGAA
jgi:RimJ/RimL family protein N-acetyltransferase